MLSALSCMLRLTLRLPNTDCYSVVFHSCVTLVCFPPSLNPFLEQIVPSRLPRDFHGRLRALQDLACVHGLRPEVHRRRVPVIATASSVNGRQRGKTQLALWKHSERQRKKQLLHTHGASYCARVGRNS